MIRLVSLGLVVLGVAGCKKKAPEAPIPPLPTSVESRLTLVSVSPSRIEPQDPTSVRMFGSGFARGATVLVGEQPAMSVTWASSNQLDVVLPSLPEGSWDVKVTNPDQASDTLRGGLQVGVRSEVGAACDFVVLYFETGSASLTNQAESTLGTLVPCYQSASELLRISGHADERGTTDYNLALSYRRALNVQGFLVGLGLPAVRMPVTSFGEEQPAEKGSSEQVWAKNRRVELALD